jgi:hypothetical protein
MTEEVAAECGERAIPVVTDVGDPDSVGTAFNADRPGRPGS